LIRDYLRSRVRGWLIYPGNDLLARSTRERLSQRGGIEERQPDERRTALN
jgi:hypothetical protein